MLLWVPLAGIILLITSPHKKWLKILLVALCVVYSLGLGNIIVHLLMGLLG